MNLNSLKKMDKDDLLNLIGLETRRSTAEDVVPLLGAFAAGLLVGAGLGLLLAPKPGNQLRDDLRQKLQSGQDYLANTLQRGEGAQSQGASSSRTT
ncbi:YtxH domain-containing protein [Myxococcus stipitatus]|uniref:YtxH domain-containing protein n=1 Tax=Myxococcus stipitatus TaxID=83455 RepID=UPI001F3754B6|nr:YtxH domain-containing protein [Myxococcus stipitatus]MCE9666929.1 YtxH domain-containing protein [Myxococcus stipitatus]